MSMSTFANKPRFTPQNDSTNQLRSQDPDPAHARHRATAIQAKAAANRCACGSGCPACTTKDASPTIQREGRGTDTSQNTAQVHAAAKFGTSGAGGPLPYAEAIQKS